MEAAVRQILVSYCRLVRRLGRNAARSISSRKGMREEGVSPMVLVMGGGGRGILE